MGGPGSGPRPGVRKGGMNKKTQKIVSRTSIGLSMKQAYSGRGSKYDLLRESSKGFSGKKFVRVSKATARPRTQISRRK